MREIYQIPPAVRQLLDAALEARQLSYSPYSGFAVGAALRLQGGEIITGTNIENISFGATVCAERVALWSAVGAGKKNIQDLAVVTGSDQIVPPCALCLQVIMEFGISGHIYLQSAGQSQVWQTDLDSLLPHPVRIPGLGEDHPKA